MKHLTTLSFALLLSTNILAGTKISCIDSASFKRMAPVKKGKTCKELRGNLNKALLAHRATGKLRAVVTDDAKKSVILLGEYKIENLEAEGKIYHKELVTIETHEGPTALYLGGKPNQESGIEIEYDSDMDMYAPFSGNALIGEIGVASLICYDVDLMMQSSGCKKK